MTFNSSGCSTSASKPPCLRGGGFSIKYSSDQLVAVIQSNPDDEDAIEAAKNFAMLDLALLKVEIECGMYKKPLEVLAREAHYEPLPPEVRAVVIAAWIRGDMLPKTTIEQMVPERPASH
jgi:hypothetical protein